MNNSTCCYDRPQYYEVAFSFRDLPAEVGVLRRTIDTFARREVRRVLQLACGPSQHLPELAKAGFEYVGLDLNPSMIDHSRQLAASSGLTAEFQVGDMVSFTLDRPVDYVLIALGDLYAKSTAELQSLLNSVAAVLAPGGLFLLDWCVQFEPEKFFDSAGQSWTIEQDEVRVDATVTMQPLDRAEQTYLETLTLQVRDGAESHHLESASVKRAIYPQEFLFLIQSRREFEFLGWWNNWDLSQPISAGTANIFRPITLLRRC